MVLQIVNDLHVFEEHSVIALLLYITIEQEWRRTGRLFEISVVSGVILIQQ